MARVSISKAAKLAGLSRSSIYNYISTGQISTSKDEQGRPYIDTSEILRVFGTLHDKTVDDGHTVQAVEQPVGQAWTPSLDTLSIKNQLLEQQLQEAKEREQALKAEFAEREAWYQSQIKSFADGMKLLEAPKTQPQPYPRLWWQFWK